MDRQDKIEGMRHERELLKNRIDVLLPQVRGEEHPDPAIIAKIMRLYQCIDEYSNGILFLQEAK